MKRIIVIWGISIIVSITYARTITLDNSCYIVLPDSLTEGNAPNSIYRGYNKDCDIVLKTLNVDDFDHAKVICMMDTLCFNLKAFKRIEERHEGIWQLSEDFSYKFYENDSVSYKIVTYTFYSFQLPYCMLCIYNNDKGLECFEKVISGINKPKPEGFLKQLFVCWHHSKGALCLIIVLSCFLGQLMGAIFGRNNSLTISLVLTLALSVVLLYNIWGYWYLIAVILMLTLILAHLSAKVTFKQFMNRLFD